jgi:hypothetical protein
MFGEESEWSWRRDESDRERGDRHPEEKGDGVGGGTVVSSVVLFQKSEGLTGSLVKARLWMGSPSISVVSLCSNGASQALSKTEYRRCSSSGVGRRCIGARRCLSAGNTSAC